MTSKPYSKTDFSEFDNRVGQAWSQHYRKQYDAAIEQFRRLIDEWPDHIDANYGLALSLKMAGQKEKAAEQFAKTKQYVEAERSKVNGDTARFDMLSRMIEQQIATLK